MSRRTRRTGKDEPLMQLEDGPKTGRTQATIKLTPEQKETVRKFVTAYLVKYEGFKTVNEIVDFLKENCSQTPIKKEFTDICDITNSGIKLTTVTQYVRTYLNNIQTRDVTTRSIFPDGNIRLTVYKQSPYPDLLKIFKKDIKSISDADKEEIAMALNDSSSPLFNSLFDILEEGTERSFKRVIDMIENVPDFNINTNANGKTLLMGGVLVLLNALNSIKTVGRSGDSLPTVYLGIRFLEKLLNSYAKKLDPTIPYTMEYTFGNDDRCILRISPISLSLYMLVYYTRELSAAYHDLINLVHTFIINWKLPSFYIDGLECPGKCYGVIETRDGNMIVLDNLWILTTFDVPYIKMLIKQGGLDLKAGHGNSNLSNTIYFKIKNMETDKKALEDKSTALRQEIQPLEHRLDQLEDELRMNHKKVIAVSSDLRKLNTLYTTFKNENIF
jgi:hypothetical protein